jgi:hypothetical protein
MKLRNRAAPPEDHDKAIYNPDSALNKYQAEITDAARFWGEQEARAGAIGSGALLSASQNIMGSLGMSIAAWNELAQDPFAEDREKGMEFSRRLALSTLGVSMLLRTYWEDKIEYVEQIEFFEETGTRGTVLDMVATDPWQDFRAHTAIVAEGALPQGPAEQWFRDGDLWVRQARPAEPTKYLERVFLPQVGVQVDFSQYETLVPYLQAR